MGIKVSWKVSHEERSVCDRECADEREREREREREIVRVHVCGYEMVRVRESVCEEMMTY